MRVMMMTMIMMTMRLPGDECELCRDEDDDDENYEDDNDYDENDDDDEIAW